MVLGSIPLREKENLKYVAARFGHFGSNVDK